MPVVHVDEQASRALSSSRRGPRCSTPHRGVLTSATAAAADEIDGDLRHIAGGSVDGNLQAQSFFPLTVNRGNCARHPLHDLTARLPCDANDGPKPPPRTSIVLLHAYAAQTGERPGNAVATAFADGFQRTDLSSSRLDLPSATASRSVSKDSTC